ncbi:O-antigen ligase family protein [uncultured Sphaerochaeta sp.]|uniref:O-antigen ligase family protein n=1 Tax=uncultured Sphaerochaeta sp. TaxID=886478 RepID=UPI002A0A4A7F|nr:O-antigen ligase family protein [uncultured Sphaerochaeta sp.]
MKYVIFTFALVLGVPVIAGATAFSKLLKRLAFSVMIVSFLFGSKFSINIMSMEFYRGPVRGFEVTFADLIAMGLALGMLLRTGSKIVWRPRFFFPLFAFFIFAIVNVQKSMYQIYGWFAIWQLFRMGFMYWCVINFFATEDYDHDSILALMQGYIASGWILGAISFKQKYLDGIYRTNAFFDHSNTVPSFALIILCVLLTWVIFDGKLSKIQFILGFFASLGLVFAILSTGSRTGMVTAAGAMVCAIIIARHKAKMTGHMRFAIIFLICCMVLGGLMVMDTVIDRFLNAPESSEEARDEFKIAAVMMADDFKIGVGLNQYSQVLTDVKKYRENFQVMRNEEQGGVAHHIYLLTAAEMGYGGMYAFVAIAVLFGLSMVFYGLSWKSLEQRLLLALAVGFFILFLIGFYEWVIRQSTVLYQLVVAVGFGQSLIYSIKIQKKKNLLSLGGDEQ